MLFVISQPSTDIKPWCSLYLCSTKFVRTFPFLGYFDPNWEVFISCYYLFILTECSFTSFSRTFQLSCPHNLFQTTESIWSKFLSAHQIHLCTVPCHWWSLPSQQPGTPCMAICDMAWWLPAQTLCNKTRGNYASQETKNQQTSSKRTCQKRGRTSTFCVCLGNTSYFVTLAPIKFSLAWGTNDG